MNMSGLGGIGIAVIAGIALFVFIPHWASGEKLSQAEATRTEVKQTKQQIQLSRLTRTSRVAAAVALMSLAASVFVAFLAITNALAWLAFIFLLPSFAACTVLAVTAARASRKFAVTKNVATNRRLAFENQASSQPVPQSQMNDRAWTPTKLPTPLANRIGELRHQAPVVSFESVRAQAQMENGHEAQEAETEPIDVIEILKRRRAI